MSNTSANTAATVARNLRIWRSAYGVGQRRLAELYGASQARIASIEEGRSALQTRTLERLAQATGMTVAELVSHRHIPGHVTDNTNG